MEAKQKLTNGFKSHKNISSTEKTCKKCGFVTFSLHVLHSHQYKCRGTLLGSMKCCYCKRKFGRLFLFRQHKKTCLNTFRKKKIWRQIFNKNKLSADGVIGKVDNGSQKKASSKSTTILCPTCMKWFPSKLEYDLHEKKGSCTNATARKSFPNAGHKTKLPKVHPKEQSGDNGRKSGALPIDFPEEVEKSEREIGVSCSWCKNVYPSKQILLKHLERNSRCALALHKQNSQGSRSAEAHTARKSIQHHARKSFPNHKHVSPRFNPKIDQTSGSARKSLPNSSRNRLSNSPMSHSPSPLKSLNQCPVCYQKIPDPFKFFQHQKKLNHWGKATKSINKMCKCPFCGKQFMYVLSFNAHVRNHSDKSKKEIDSFLKKTTCDVCSQIFGSETAKYQHMRYFHSKPALDNSLKNLDSSSYSLLPLVIKQKLRMHPNTCPICEKEFPATYFRNRHFQENHLDAELECKFCPRKFGGIESMENHMQEAHYGDFQFECLACKIHLATAPHVVLHCTKVHSSQDPKTIIRSREDKSLVDAPGFEYPAQAQPVDVEGKNGFYCDICDLHFQKKAGLQSHRQSKSHKDTVVRNLDTMRQSISDLPSPKRTPKVAKKTPEILTCTECFDEFSSVKDFVPHRLSHFGRGKYMKINDLNRYTCEICGEVSNSHSKVQMHLFWHLQVESTAVEKSAAKDKGKTDPIVPDRLSGQQVARKSFGKSPDSQQEIVIGGVKKSLFTCENCNIGFTTPAHYSLHVRKLCKKKVSAEKAKGPDGESSAGSSRMAIGKILVEKKNVKYCATCNTLYDSSAREAHQKLCGRCTQDTSDVKSTDTERIKSTMVHQNVVAACVICCSLFGNPKAFTEHMLGQHATAENSEEDNEDDGTSEEFTSSILCTTCNCLFLSSIVQENHETFCENASYHTFDTESTKEILKPFSKLWSSVAICISCSVAFSNIRILKMHVSQHEAKASQKSKEKSASLNGPETADEVVLSGEESSDKANTLPVSSSQDALEGTSAQKSLDVSSSVSNDSILTDRNISFVADPDSSITTNPNDTIDSLSVPSMLIGQHGESENTAEEPITILRETFSQLFCILINDKALMQQLGYGLQPVDDVLINVLQQMGQAPVEKEDEDSDIDCFRKNIRIFLDFCLKDQVMELIESGKTSVDDIVLEALKTFTSEEVNTSKEMEEE